MPDTLPRSDVVVMVLLNLHAQLQIMGHCNSYEHQQASCDISRFGALMSLIPNAERVSNWTQLAIETVPAIKER